jgi:hypothetical protein
MYNLGLWLQALLSSGAVPASIANGTVTGLNPDDRKLLADLLTACFPESSSSLSDLANVLLDLSRVLAVSRATTKVCLCETKALSLWYLMSCHFCMSCLCVLSLFPYHCDLILCVPESGIVFEVPDAKVLPSICRLSKLFFGLQSNTYLLLGLASAHSGCDVWLAVCASAVCMLHRGCIALLCQLWGYCMLILYWLALACFNLVSERPRARS